MVANHEITGGRNLTPDATAHHRRRQFCKSCGHVHRKNAGCASAARGDAITRLHRLAGVPDIRPYPYTAVNLARTA